MSALSPLISETLKHSGEVVIAVTGNSMLPLLRNRGDKVRLIKPTENPLKKWDIILFLRSDGAYILHRIVSVKKDGYVVIGDNQWIKEYPVLPSQVIGVVSGMWRKGKYLSCDSSCYQLYSRIWTGTYPIRWLFFRSRQFFLRILKGLGGK
jgi:hypothetical protein